MIIFINSFANFLAFVRNDSKKAGNYLYTKSFNYSILSLSNKIKAIKDSFENEEVINELHKESNQLIISDEVIGYDTSELPSLNKKKLDDIFNTNFRMCYPDFNNYYLKYHELSKDDAHSYYFYEFAKRNVITKIIDAFKEHGIKISSINNFASLFTVNAKTLSYPKATLVIGEYSSELIITKGDSVYGINLFRFGEKTLLNKSFYLDSAYGFNNDESISYAGFIKSSIKSKTVMNDESIINTPITEGFSSNPPKELRLLKEQQLENYILKNNYRKYYAHVLSNIMFYNDSPYFFPIKEVEVISSDESFKMIDEFARNDKTINFVRSNESIDKLIKKGISHNPLFDTKVSKERRRIDWGKLLTMEIGKKKKA